MMENLFAALTHEDSIAFLLSVFVCFLIGFITGWALYGGRARRFRKEAHSLRKQLKQLSAERDDLREALDLTKADYARLEKQYHELGEQLAKVEAERNVWQADLKKALSRAARAEEQARSYSITIEDLNNQLLGLKTRLQEKSPAPPPGDVTTERLASLEEKIAQLIQENAHLRNARSQDDLIEARRRLAELDRKLNALLEENQALRKELASLRGMSQSNQAERTHESETLESLAQRAAQRSRFTRHLPLANPNQKDDLTRIKGIGKQIEARLNELGIFTFEQLSKLTDEDIRELAEVLAFPGRIERDDWVGQARRLLQVQKSEAEKH